MRACLLLLLATCLVAAETAQLRLDADLRLAQADLQAERERIETERRQALERIDAAQAQLTQARATLEQAHSELAQRQQQLLSARERVDSTASVAAGLARLLASEGMNVALGLDADELLRQWPDMRQQVQRRLGQWRQDLRIWQETAEVLDRRGHPVTVPIFHWGAVQRLALGEQPEQRGLCRRLDDGSWQIAGPLFPADARPPVDISGRLASTVIQPGGALALLRRAGPFAWPILAVALLGLLLILERCWFLWRWRLPAAELNRVLEQAGQPEQALACLRRRAAPVAQLLRGMLRMPGGEERVQRAGAALVEAEVQLQRGLRLLAVLAATAPLLGLLGTVTGMITSFHALDLAQGGGASQLSAGIGEALLTTEFGLIVAVPLVLLHACFARDAQRRRAQAEAAAMRLLAELEARDA